MKTTFPSLIILLLTIFSCTIEKSQTNNFPKKNISTKNNYKGTASVTQGIGTTTSANIFVCDKGRKTNLGKITS